MSTPLSPIHRHVLAAALDSLVADLADDGPCPDAEEVVDALTRAAAWIQLPRVEVPPSHVDAALSEVADWIDGSVGRRANESYMDALARWAASVKRETPAQPLPPAEDTDPKVGDVIKWDDLEVEVLRCFGKDVRGRRLISVWVPGIGPVWGRYEPDCGRAEEPLCGSSA